MLILPIKKKYFDMIISGIKKEEYREIKPYYISRFNAADYICEDDTPNKQHRIVWQSTQMDIILRNGYSSKSPFIKCNVHIYKGYGKEEWGAEPNKKYFVLSIKKILEIGNLTTNVELKEGV